MTSGWSLQDDLTIKCNAVVQKFTRYNVCTQTIDSLSEKVSQVRNKLYVVLPDRM
jgi:hypothetical protein